MVRKVKERCRATFTAEEMTTAVQAVIEGMKLRQAALEYGVKFQTLQRYVQKKRADDSCKMVPNYNVRRIFTLEQEKSLCEYLKTCSKMAYGLTTLQTRQLAYEMAVMNNVTIPQNWHSNHCAGIEWLRGFMKRCGSLSIRQPEGCSLSRLTSFNKYTVNLFFDNLEAVIAKTPSVIENVRIFNLDETSTTTVQKPKRVLAEKGVKQLNSCTSGERGVLITTCVIIGANGSFLPPAMVFPRKFFKMHMIAGAPAGTLGLANPSGWMNGELFSQVMDHFIKFSNSSPENPSILIYDNHESHVTLEVVQKAKSNGVSILTLPPHCSNKLQPLDVSVFAPFKSYYNAALDNWMLNHPGTPITIYQIAQCVGEAHMKALTPKNIASGFQATGIFPINRHVFSEDDFLMSAVTDRPFEEHLSAGTTTAVTENVPQTETVKLVQKLSEATCSMETHDNSDIAENIADRRTSFVSPHEFRGFPKAGKRKTTRKRKTKKSAILTNTPDMEEIKNAKKLNTPCRTISQKSKKLMLELSSGPKKQHKSVVDEVSDSDSTDEEVVYEEFSEGEEYIETVDVNTEDISGEITLNSFVLIRFPQKIHYVAKVTKIYDESNELEVSYLRKSGKMEGSFIFPKVVDVATVAREDVVVVLPTPTNIGNKRLSSYYKFSVSFENIQLR